MRIRRFSGQNYGLGAVIVLWPACINMLYLLNFGACVFVVPF